MAQHQLVLDNEDFATWTNENCLCVVGHDGAVGKQDDHKPAEEVDPKTKEKRTICPLYHGLTCDEHKAVKSDAGSGKDGLPKIDFPNGVPNTWMIGPDGVVKQMDQKAAASPKTAIEALTAYQAGYKDKPVPSKKYEIYKKLFADADKALEGAKWKDALSAYLKVDADGKKLSSGLVDKLKTSLTALNEKVSARFEELKAAEGDDATKLKNVRALRADVSAKFSSGNIAALADIDAWIKDQAAAAAAAVPAVPAGMK